MKDLKTLREIANLMFYSNDLSRDVTIIDYLKELLATLWNEEDNFSGKRPFGNSGWQYDIYKVLIEKEHITGTLDEFGDVENVEIFEADKIITDIIIEVMF